MNEAEFDKEFAVPDKTINDIIKEIVESKRHELYVSNEKHEEDF
jgi:hypothetical protein